MKTLVKLKVENQSSLIYRVRNMGLGYSPFSVNDFKFSVIWEYKYIFTVNWEMGMSISIMNIQIFRDMGLKK